MAIEFNSPLDIFGAHEPKPAEARLPHARGEALQRAYDVSTRITKEYSKSFYFSSLLLPPAKRQAVHALYAFCRLSDNIVDAASEHAHEELAAWRAKAFRTANEQHDNVLLAWADTRERFAVPGRYAEELLDGMEMDLTIPVYETWEQLERYCYCVASTVGLMSMHITGYGDPRARDYAIKLGVALQLTNILRDVGEDAARGRVYLPRVDIEQFGLSYADFCHGTVDTRFKALMEFEIQRAERLYDESWAGIALLSPDSRLSVATAAVVYRGILNQIRRIDYDVYAQRAHLGLRGKLTRLPSIWWRTRRLAGVKQNGMDQP
jgi:phytoene synthase